MLFITKAVEQFDEGMNGFSINTMGVFFWNDFSIWYMKINEPEEGFHTLDLIVSPLEKQT